jgi:hypothetical protein
MRGLGVLLVAALAGCTTPPKYYSRLNHQPISLRAGELESGGIAFVTPSTVTGQEQKKQALKVVTLAETLPADALRRVSAATGARYLAQIKLQGFGQGSKGRFGFLGLRVSETLYGDVRLYLQIWDSRDGSIA